MDFVTFSWGYKNRECVGHLEIGWLVLRYFLDSLELSENASVGESPFSIHKDLQENHIITGYDWWSVSQSTDTYMECKRMQGRTYVQVQELVVSAWCLKYAD